MNDEQVVEADLTWLEGSFRPNIQSVTGADGRISEVGPLGRTTMNRLADRAILPGLVNVHSHAFQRGLRGLGERFPEGAGSFWTWREAMYRLVESLSAETLYDLSRQAFREMLRCGITCVGEFHYVHHDHSGEGFALDEIILNAARDAGIRMVLLQTYYQIGGIGRPLEGGQRRFRCDSPRKFWRQFDRLAGQPGNPRISFGAAVHSVRAATIADLVSIHAESVRRGLVFHIHVEEQRREIDDCTAAYGLAPMALLNQRLEVDERLTAVHCTHTTPEDLRAFVQSGGSICLCPTTEGNLGDGIPDIAAIRSAAGVICLGTDSNVRLCPTEDMRWLEYVQRLRSESRGVLTDDEGRVASNLFRMATESGARSLGLNCGSIAAGNLADFVTLDLKAPPLAGWSPETLLDGWVFGTGEDVVDGVCVGGTWHRFR
jgi:formimidoylglutamate deiminase